MSVLFEASFDAGGSADSYWFSIALLMRTAKLIGILDLMVDQQKALTTLADIARRQLRDKDRCFRGNIDDPLEDVSTWYKAKTYQTFAMMPDGLVLAFNKYSVAPGACGGISITIPWPDLDPILSRQAHDWIKLLR